jgi:hypothetical protein
MEKLLKLLRFVPNLSRLFERIFYNMAIHTLASISVQIIQKSILINSSRLFTCSIRQDDFIQYAVVLDNAILARNSQPFVF